MDRQRNPSTTRDQFAEERAFQILYFLRLRLPHLYISLACWMSLLLGVLRCPISAEGILACIVIRPGRLLPAYLE